MAEYVPPEAEDAYVVFEGGELPAADLDAPLIGHRYERTLPKDTGAPWDMAAWIRADRARRDELGTFDPGGHVEIVARGYLVEPNDLPRSPKPIAKRLLEQGWEVRCGCSIQYVTPTLYVNGSDDHSRGDLRYQDRDEWCWSIAATMRRGDKPVAAFWATWVTIEQVGKRPATSFQDAITHDLVLHRQYVSKAKEFEAWLAIFAPVAES